MTEEQNSLKEDQRDTIYQIRVKGHLGSEWINYFHGFTIHCREAGETVLTGPVMDQAELHGLIRRIRDLGLPLISIMRKDNK
ncbi:hypothetical protein LCM20_08770 [Halobacillus litoralis]|uniref:hypothetical protein n=1 Tax=Halobacillus litoralis TaxID=45668 RepID=UPI001CD783F6|nr:hypothetical protein [Halobacillus litoralis]MCA0970678.1 hypothetical protein [Halobacillus litoralis]